MLGNGFWNVMKLHAFMWECLVNCTIFEYECTVKDNVGGDEDGDGLHPGHLNLFQVTPIYDLFWQSWRVRLVGAMTCVLTGLVFEMNLHAKCDL